MSLARLLSVLLLVPLAAHASSDPSPKGVVLPRQSFSDLPLAGAIFEARQEGGVDAVGNNNRQNGGGGAGSATGDPQTSLTLDPSVIAPGFALTGQEGGGDPGQVASLTSTTNFINFCFRKTITNGQQVKASNSGSCNPAPIGEIPPIDKMPSCKFTDELSTSSSPFPPSRRSWRSRISGLGTSSTPT